MKKRAISLLLAMIILAGMLNVCSVGVFAAEDTQLKTSAEAIKILKAYEGFSRVPYWDYAQWTVGYGTKCPSDRLEYYKQNGITESEAESLLQVYIEKFENELYKFIKKTGVKLNQHQFDALLLFSYNCGSAWTSSSLLRTAVVNGAGDNEIIYAFSRWCNAGGKIKTSLLNRRLRDANLYLNGVYSTSNPVNYGYVLYDACGGTVSPNVQGYDITLTADFVPEDPTFPGYKFLGWFTDPVGGTRVTKLDASTKNLRLYAHWEDDEGNAPTQNTNTSVTVTVTADNVNVRKGPGTNYAATGRVNTGKQLLITEISGGANLKWGKFSDGWIALKYTDYDKVTAESSKPSTPSVPESTGKVTGTVKVSSTLRVRSGPSTGYSVVTQLKNGTKVEILEQKTAGTMVWGRISQGWVSMDYIVLDKETQQPTTPPETQPPETTPPTTQPTEKPEASQNRTGTVKVDDQLRIRSGAGTGNKVVGYYRNGDKITITETQKVGNTQWGKTDKGWISLDYVVLDPLADNSTNTGNSTGGNTATQKTTGTVKVKDMLRIRKGPGTSYAIAGYLKNGAKVEITEQKKVGSVYWGKIDKGWISLDYVVTDQQTTGTQNVTKTVTADCLRIRSAAGTSNKIVGYLYEGAKVEILETKKVGSMTWGRISQGWISMNYVK